MILDNLRVPGFNTTLMGVVRGVADYYHIAASDALLYGGSGHAFLINIHDSLCPSGPYCWKQEPFQALMRNLGLEMTHHGFFGAQSTPGERAAVERLLCRKLDEGVPCSLLNMENQLITGYDDTGFLTTQPWAPHTDFPPRHLTFGSWEELQDGIHMSFYSFACLEPAPVEHTLAQSLDHAVDLWRQPERHSGGAYGAGPEAYANWVAAVQKGEGGSHGNWWNGTVWAECRARAAEYLEETAPLVGPEAPALAQDYRAMAADLELASDRELDALEKVGVLRRARDTEEACVRRLERLAGRRPAAAN